MYMLSQCFISDFDPWQVLRFFSARLVYLQLYPWFAREIYKND